MRGTVLSDKWFRFSCFMECALLFSVYAILAPAYRVMRKLRGEAFCKVACLNLYVLVCFQSFSSKKLFESWEAEVR